MPTILAKQASASLQLDDLPCLTTDLPLQTCRVCVVVPVRNEVESLPALLNALTHQVDAQGRPLDFDSYEVLLLANNCSDGSVALAKAWGLAYPRLKLHVLEVTLPQAQACVGYARQMVMNEAYRRLSSIGLNRRIIASTDGDTEVASTWLSAMRHEFDQGADHGIEAVFGRIFTRRTAKSGIQAETSLYFLRYLAHRYLTAQLETFLDPLPHDGWPRHYQHFGANMAILAETYGRVGGMPSVPNQEDVALYRRLQQVDAKMRHSPHVKVVTSARCWGRTQGGLAERLSQLTQASRQRQTILVEPPQLTEARILVRRQLRQAWAAQSRDVGHFSSLGCPTRLQLLAQRLGFTTAQLQPMLEAAPTFGVLIEAVENQQKQSLNTHTWTDTAVEISLANMYLRQQVQELLRSAPAASITLEGFDSYRRLEALKQVQPIPLFSLTY